VGFVEQYILEDVGIALSGRWVSTRGVEELSHVNRIVFTTISEVTFADATAELPNVFSTLVGFPKEFTRLWRDSFRKEGVGKSFA
jgi:hypothetical protein